jgi:hypothetical protein
MSKSKIVEQYAEIERLRQVARNVYEVWAGSEGIPMPETAAEAYLLRLVEQMRDEAKHGLHNDLGNRRDAGPIGGASVLTDGLAGKT